MEHSIVVNNKPAMQYEVDLEDDKAVLEYRWHDGKIALMHTFVPARFEGRGVAALLAKTALEEAKAQHIQVKVYCPYVQSYMEKHPEYLDLVVD